jgi:hypothetical protein
MFVSLVNLQMEELGYLSVMFITKHFQWVFIDFSQTSDIGHMGFNELHFVHNLTFLKSSKHIYTNSVENNT